MTTWVQGAEQTNFTIHHLPFGVFTHNKQQKRIGVAIADKVIDLFALAENGFLASLDINHNIFKSDYLNPFMELGKPTSSKLRSLLQNLLSKDDLNLQQSNQLNSFLLSIEECTMHLPIYVRDYTDFYSSIEHATNVGTMFRGKENALQPNWKHLPVGYHGRASSIIASGEDIYRPSGQKSPNEEGGQPQFGTTELLDIELEMAFVTCKENELGTAITTEQAEDYIWGITLFNDWSARDIQKWEYVPLGPFLGKSFASSISHWVTPLEALEPFRVQGPTQNPEVLPYLSYTGKKNYDIRLEVWLKPENGESQKISNSNFKYMYWNMCQQLAHHTVNGCNLNIGDLYGSGTISGKEKETYGSLLELTWRGEQPITLKDGSTRTFLEDGDTITLKGFCDNGLIKFGLGEVETKILPAKA